MGENVNGKLTNVLGFLALIIMTVAAVTLIYLQFMDK
jgi:Mn2+/Fe2+ NRAMP family transporter